jgi:hypothetical protein
VQSPQEHLAVESIADHEIAQKRIDERRRNRDQFYFRLAALTALVFVSIFTGSGGLSCLLPVLIFVGLVAASKGVELFFSSPHQELPTPLVEQELEWLFGQDWQNSTGSVEYAFAQDRIRKRQIARWKFPIHLLIFGLIYFLITQFINGQFAPFNMTAPVWLYALPLIYLVFLIRHAWSAFPTRGLLERRERAAALTMDRELQAIQPRKLKREETLKPDARYAISGDGELVEVPDSEAQVQKEKRGDVFERLPLATKWRGDQGVR